MFNRKQKAESFLTKETEGTGHSFKFKLNLWFMNQELKKILED